MLCPFRHKAGHSCVLLCGPHRFACVTSLWGVPLLSCLPPALLLVQALLGTPCCCPRCSPHTCVFSVSPPHFLGGVQGVSAGSKNSPGLGEVRKASGNRGGETRARRGPFLGLGLNGGSSSQLGDRFSISCLHRSIQGLLMQSAGHFKGGPDCCGLLGLAGWVSGQNCTLSYPGRSQDHFRYFFHPAMFKNP